MVCGERGIVLVSRNHNTTQHRPVLGPILRNMSYNIILEIKIPTGVKLTGFADDVARTVVVISKTALMNLEILEGGEVDGGKKSRGCTPKN